MRSLRNVVCLLFFSVTLLLATEEKSEKQKPLVSELRPLCTTLTQNQVSRFERCANGEVMTGIRSLDPLMVYCTRLLANCINYKRDEAHPITQ